jgi:hypothetical protein
MNELQPNSSPPKRAGKQKLFLTLVFLAILVVCLAGFVYYAPRQDLPHAKLAMIALGLCGAASIVNLFRLFKPRA